MKIKTTMVLFIILVLVSSCIRIVNIYISYPVDQQPIGLPLPDVYRDYLVSSHILHYDDFPSTGPYAMALYDYSVRHSFVYYTILAQFLRIKDEMFFLGWVNIFLQLLSLIIIYQISKKLFSQSTALVTLLFLGIGKIGVGQSLFMAQTNLASSFSLISLFLLFLFYKTGKTIILIPGTLFIVLASSIHFSYVGIIPFFLILTFIILKRNRSNIFLYLPTVILIPLFYLLFFFPQAVEIIQNGHFYPSANNIAFVHSFGDFLNNFIKGLTIIFETIFISSDLPVLNMIGKIMIIILIGFGILYFGSRDVVFHTKSKLLFILMVPLIFVFIIAGIDYYKGNVYFYYFLPVIWIIFVVIAEIVTASRIYLLRHLSVRVVLLCILLFVFSDGFNLFIRPQSQQKLKITGEQIAQEILTIKSQENHPNIHFFQIRIYYGKADLSGYDVVFWSQLEKRLNTKFIKIGDKAENNISINDDKYIFLVCLPNEVEKTSISDCIESFITSRKEYKEKYELSRRINPYNSYQVFLMKRNEE